MPSVVRTAAPISSGAPASAVKFLFRKFAAPGKLPFAFSPRKPIPDCKPLAKVGIPESSLLPTPLITAPATGSTISPARLKLAPSNPKRNLFLRRTAASSFPVKDPSSSVCKNSGIASQLSASVVMVLGETNTSATPVPAVVKAARPARVCVRAPGALRPNACADLPNHVCAFFTAVPDCKAFLALSAFETQLNTPIPGAP